MQKWSLLVTVFISGMLVMILELAGTRLIAPYFGSSIYTWTSMIGIILGCLSIGYWIGGRIADKKATYKHLGYLLLLNSAACLILYLFASHILLFLYSTIQDTAIGTFVATIALFSAPSILFGIVSPYAAKLQVISLKDSGKTIGNLYAIATIGSITGTFLTGYYLLSFISSYHLILIVSVVLLANTLLLSIHQFFRTKVVILGIIITSVLYFPPLQYQFSIHTLKAIEHTQYSDYYVLENSSEEGTMRMLLTDFRTAQSKYLVGEQNKLISTYTKFFTLPSCFNLNNNVLIVGGGAFSYPKYFSQTFPESTIDVVEIDPELTTLAEEYFELPVDRENIEIFNTDGRVYLNRNTKKYNAILMDAFSTHIIPFQLITKESIEKIHDSLTDDGLVILNIPSFLNSEDISLIDIELKTLKEVFENVELYQVSKGRDLQEIQGFILVGYKGSPKLTSTCLASEEGFLQNKLDYIEKENVPTFTDDFAPVEHYLF